MKAALPRSTTLVLLALALCACAGQPSVPADTAAAQGTELLQQGDATGALQVLLQVDDDQATAETWYLRGNAHAALGETSQARDAYQAALALEPKHLDAQANLGVVLYELGEFAQAEVAFRAVIEALPQDADLHYNLGGVLLALGELQQAEAELLLASTLDDRLPEPYLGLGTLYELNGDSVSAIAAYEAYIERSQDAYWLEQARAAIVRLRGAP